MKIILKYSPSCHKNIIPSSNLDFKIIFFLFLTPSYVALPKVHTLYFQQNPMHSNRNIPIIYYFVNNSNINLIELMTRDKIMYAHNTFICYVNNKNVLYLDDIF